MTVTFQVSRFILAHLELFGTILRDHMSSFTLGSVEVLALTTSLISRCGIGQNITNEVWTLSVMALGPQSSYTDWYTGIVLLTLVMHILRWCTYLNT